MNSNKNFSSLMRLFHTVWVFFPVLSSHFSCNNSCCIIRSYRVKPCCVVYTLCALTVSTGWDFDLIFFMHCIVVTIVTMHSIEWSGCKVNFSCCTRSVFLIVFEISSENINTKYTWILSVSCKFSPNILHHTVLVLNAIFSYFHFALHRTIYARSPRFYYKMLVN